EFSEHAKHVQETLAGGCGRVDRLFGRPERRTPSLQRPHNVLKVSDRARQAIDPRDNQRVALPNEIENGRKLRAPLRTRPARLLLADHITAGRLQRLDLDREVLIRGAHAGISDCSHGQPPKLSHLGLNHAWILSQKRKVNPYKTKYLSQPHDSAG